MSVRSTWLIGGVLAALLFGLLGVAAGLNGFRAAPASADGLTAWPSLLTGLACLAAAIGLWRLKKWAEWVYLAAFAGHVLIQALLYFGRAATGRAAPPLTIAFLFVVPLVSLAVLADMEYHRRRGILA
jgi:hypothetical protein